jgi:hypothetical protein
MFTMKFIPIKPSLATDSDAPGSWAGHRSGPSPEPGHPAATSGAGPCTMRPRLTRLWTGARRRWWSAWGGQGGSRGRSSPREGLGGLQSAPSGSVNARPPRAGQRQRPAGQGDGGASAMGVSGGQPPDVARSHRRRSRAWTRRPFCPVGAFCWPLSPVVGSAGAGGQHRGGPGPRGGRARGRAATGGRGSGPARRSVLAPLGVQRWCGRPGGSPGALPASGGGRAYRRSTGGRSGRAQRGATPPSARGTPPRRGGRAAQPRRAANGSTPGPRGGTPARRCTVHSPSGGLLS